MHERMNEQSMVHCHSRKNKVMRSSVYQSFHGLLVHDFEIRWLFDFVQNVLCCGSGLGYPIIDLDYSSIPKIVILKYEYSRKQS